MAEDEMYLGNLEAWVCEEKKTITYTWLSNELSVSSNVAKQMLHAFAEKKGSEVQPIYLLSGNREGYGHTLTLVAKSKLAETMTQFKPVFSLHVYSVQAVLPKDSAHLWSVDNEQRKALFTQPDNSITTNRWSAIDFPAGTEKRSAPPPAAAPQQPAPVVKKEAVKVKVQPKEEANDESSQPSSPEKTAKPATGGRLTTAKPAAASGKKGASSPTKKQPGGAREMTSFFKKAPEEEKTQTLIANAKAGKPAKGTSSPSKPRVMEGFFAKKEKMDEDHAAEEGGEEDKEEDEEKSEARRKVKLEKVQPAETDELDELLGGEEEEAEEAKPAPAPAKQKRKRAAAAKDVDDDMELESSKAKADTTKRQRLRKGKRKRSDDNDDNDVNGNDEGEVEGEAANGRPARAIKKEKEAKRDEDDGAEDEESTAMTATKKKATKRRRVVVQKEPEDEEEPEQEEAQPPKKRRAAKAAPAKKGRKEAAADEEQQEEDGEKENEEQDHNVVKQEKTKKKAATKPVAVERKEGVAKPTEYMPGQRRKKKVRRERTYTDDKGFEVTEDVWEEVSDDDTPAPVALLSVKEEATKNAEATASTARKKSTTQGNIMNFFGKK